MRGRSLRLDPDDPEKVASNWDVVCVAPDLVRGERRLRALRAQAPAPVRARRGRRDRGRPVARAPRARPVRAARRPSASAALNRELLARARPTATPPASAGRSARPTAASSCPPCWCAAGDGTDAAEAAATSAPAHAAALASASRSRRGVGGGVRVRRRSASRPARRRCSPASRSPRPASAGRPCACARPAPAAARAAARRRRARGRRRLQGARRAVATRPPARCTIEPRASGYLRCELTEATPEEGARFAAALDELVGVSDAPRYLVSRPLADPAPRRARPARARAHAPRRRSTSACTPSRPTSPATRSAPRRSRAPGAATSGPGRLVFTQRTDEGREARAEAAVGRRRLRDAGPRRLGLSAARPGPRPRGPGRRGRRRRRRRPGASAPAAPGAARPPRRRRARRRAPGSTPASRRRTISSVSGTSSRRDLRSAWLMAVEGDARNSWTTP